MQWSWCLTVASVSIDPVAFSKRVSRFTTITFSLIVRKHIGSITSIVVLLQIVPGINVILNASISCRSGECSWVIATVHNITRSCLHFINSGTKLCCLIDSPWSIILLIVLHSWHTAQALFDACVQICPSVSSVPTTLVGNTKICDDRRKDTAD